MKKTKQELKVIPAVAYCRKSTKTERAEKSIADQRERIAKLKPAEDGARYEIVRWYVKDKGVPGWKRGAARPDYFTLVNELKETKALAILVDDMDRFSRANVYDVVSDVKELREQHGIRFIHAANQGSIELRDDSVWQIAAHAMAGHEYSTRLSRRIANARCDAAKQGKRSGGKAPFAMETDGKVGLKRGDSAKVKIVQWVFDQWANERRSMSWIAGDLNKRQKVLAPKGGKWLVTAIKQLLQRKEYAGHFDFARRKVGQFHYINSDKEVVAISNFHGNRPNRNVYTDDRVFLKENHYKNPIIAPKLFNKAQARFDAMKTEAKHRPRNSYPLSSVLHCGHCGAPMTGLTPTGARITFTVAPQTVNAASVFATPMKSGKSASCPRCLPF